MIYLQLVAGLVLLAGGSDLLVRGAVSIAHRLGVSRLLIGLTLVGFGTSTPELFASVQAALLGSPGIAAGNVVGSNTANILLILGVAALIYPVRTSPEALWRDGTVMFLAALVCVAIIVFGALNRGTGACLVALLIAYVVYTYRRERVVRDASAVMHEFEPAAAAKAPRHVSVAILLSLGGLILTTIGAGYLVESSVQLARAAGISETVVGLTIVAAGTSLPELSTSVTAAIRRHGDIAFGNVIGSNIYNVLGVLGVTATVQPIEVPPEIIRLDIWVMLAATVLLLGFSVTGWSLNRIEGFLFLAGYGVYVSYLATGGF